MKLHLRAAAAAVAAVCAMCFLGAPVQAAPSPTGCQLGPDGSIKHVFYLQFDNVHLSRDNPNIPSDLEQMPNLLNFITQNGTMMSNHHTPLISHTAVDILTALTGNYGDKMGVPIGNSFRYYNPDGTTNGASSFAYWTDPLAAFSGPAITDTTPQMIDQRGKVHPAPWVAFTRAGCNVGAFSIANMELENIGLDITTVFGANSPQAQEAASNSAKAAADFEGIAIHCAQNSPLCAQNSQPDVLKDEPGFYFGFNALFGNAGVQPQISPSGPIKDLDGNVIQDSHGNPGFPNAFNPSASQTLGYAAAMFEAGVQVVYAYISDAHDNHITGSGTFGPGEAGYETQLQAYDSAFGKFFARLAQDGITKDNTLFIITADEGDHFVGGPPTPSNCDGVTIACTYAQKGEVNADLSKVVATETGNFMPFTVHSDDAPTTYVTGNPKWNASTTRALEKAFGQLLGVNPITGSTSDQLIVAIADQEEQNILHMVSKDPKRTPTFVPFANPDYFLSASGNTSACNPLSACFVEQAGFAWNHGDIQTQITTTFLGMVGPGVQNLGTTGAIFSDHTDIRPTMMLLTDLEDRYTHDGRALFEVLNSNRLPNAISSQQALFGQLVNAYKAINAPLGPLGMSTLTLSTQGVLSSNPAYAAAESHLKQIAKQRDSIVKQMIAMIEKAEFDSTPIDSGAAGNLIAQSQTLLASLPH